MEWKPIESAPKNKPILIRHKHGYLPDLVRWRERKGETIVDGTIYMPVPPGWFRLFGGRSHIANPMEWMEIPE